MPAWFEKKTEATTLNMLAGCKVWLLGGVCKLQKIQKYLKWKVMCYENNIKTIQTKRTFQICITKTFEIIIRKAFTHLDQANKQA